VGLCDGDAGVAGVMQDQRGGFHVCPVGDGRLGAIVLEIVSYERGAFEAVAAGDVAVAQFVLVVEIGDRGAGHGGFPEGIVADEPGSHVAAVGPAGDCDLVFVDVAEFFQGIDPGNYVAAGAVAGVIPDGVLVGVAEVVAAAIVG